MDNDDLLIQQVEKFRFLYDKRDKDFKNKLFRENAWSTIGVMLAQPPKACEQRWGVLRNKYNAIKREYKLAPSGCGRETTQITWPYFKTMLFLEPFIVPRQTRTSFSSTFASSSKQKASSHSKCSQSESNQEVLEPFEVITENIMSTELSSAYESHQSLNEDSIEVWKELHSENVEQEDPISLSDSSSGPTLLTSNKPVSMASQSASSSSTRIEAATPMPKRRIKKNGNMEKQNKENDVSSKIENAFESFSQYLGCMNRCHPATTNQNEESLFGQQVAQDLMKVTNIEARMRLKSDIYALFVDYFKNKN